MLRYVLTASLVVSVSAYVWAQDKEPAQGAAPVKRDVVKKEGEPAKPSEKDPRKYLLELAQNAARNAEYAARKGNLEQLKEAVAQLQRLTRSLEGLQEAEKTAEELKQLIKRAPELEKFFPNLPAKPDAPRKPDDKPGAKEQPSIRVFVNGKELPPDQIKVQIGPAPKKEEPEKKD